ncbi:hypothetical protein B0H10DRAFT_2366782, partial [Mycena sp. CBHHK59/15]
GRQFCRPFPSRQFRGATPTTGRDGQPLTAPVTPVKTGTVGSPSVVAVNGLAQTEHVVVGQRATGVAPTTAIIPAQRQAPGPLFSPRRKVVVPGSLISPISFCGDCGFFLLLRSPLFIIIITMLSNGIGFLWLVTLRRLYGSPFVARTRAARASRARRKCVSTSICPMGILEPRNATQMSSPRKTDTMRDFSKLGLNLMQDDERPKSTQRV